MSVAALLPARDAAGTLGRALQSLHWQSVRPERVLVVDDGSVDATPAVIAEWRARWDAIHVLRTPGVGIARALNAGLSALLETDCDFIARMDADDISLPTRLDAQLEHARKEGLALVGAEVIHDGGEDAQGMARHVAWANALHEHEEIALGLWVDSPLPHPTWLASREAYERVGAYAIEPVPEDYEWLHRFFATGLRAGKPEGALLSWTDSPARLTRTAPEYAAEAFHAVKARALARYVPARGRPVYLFGLGPKGKALFPLVREALGEIRAVVDVHPRRVGETYQGAPIVGLQAWRAASRGAFVVIAVGTPEARAECEAECRACGLSPGRDYLAL